MQGKRTLDMQTLEELAELHGEHLLDDPKLAKEYHNPYKFGTNEWCFRKGEIDRRHERHKRREAWEINGGWLGVVIVPLAFVALIGLVFAGLSSMFGGGFMGTLFTVYIMGLLYILITNK